MSEELIRPKEAGAMPRLASKVEGIDLVRQVAGDQPQVHILGVTADDPPHDRIMLAAKARALGSVTWHVPSSECMAAIEQVHRGELWLPGQQRRPGSPRPKAIKTAQTAMSLSLK